MAKTFKYRTDANQATIVKALRKYGATVVSLHKQGKGCPDLLVGYKGKNFLMEVKNPKTRWRFTSYQKKFFAEWCGQVAVVETSEAAIALLQSLDN